VLGARRAFRPDLAEAVLEDRTLLAYAPNVPQLVLTAGGYVGITAPPGLSGNLGTQGGGAIGGNGGGLGTAFYITGFGMSVISVGNATGFAGVGGAASGSSTTGTSTALTTSLGSGASQNGGAVTRNTQAQGSSDALTDALYIGRTEGSSGTPDGGYAHSGTQTTSPPPPTTNRPPVPPARPPG
jgi:hypothetical protein